MDTTNINKDLSKYDVVVKVCDFHTKSKNAKKSIDKESFINNVLSNSVWQKKLVDGHILGLFTHLGRDQSKHSRMIPYEDNISVSPYLCNVAKDVWIDGDDLYAGITILDEYEYGRKLKYLLKKGIKIPVSMSVKAHDDHEKYYVDDLIGIDFTFRPDLEAEVIAVNFSAGSNPSNGTYSLGFIPSEVIYNASEVSDDTSEDVLFSQDELDTINDFSEYLNAVDRHYSDSFMENFSLVTYIKEMKFSPAIILKTRIEECVRYIKSKKQSVINDNANIIKQYINEYMLQFIQSSISNPSTQFNIILGLQLNRYLEDKTKGTKLQRILVRVRNQLLQTGLLPKNLQVELNTSYQDLLLEIYKYMNSRCKSSKRELPLTLSNTEVVPNKLANVG